MSVVKVKNNIKPLFLYSLVVEKGYTRFDGKYITGRRKLFRPHNVYKFLIRITSQVETVKAAILG